jgi:hypothetical protein
MLEILKLLYRLLDENAGTGCIDSGQGFLADINRKKLLEWFRKYKVSASEELLSSVQLVS